MFGRDGDAIATVALGCTVVILRRFELHEMMAAVMKYIYESGIGEELINHFMRNKILGKTWLVDDAISEINICSYEPICLPWLSQQSVSETHTRFGHRRGFMSIPPRLPDHRSPKRQRFPSVDEDDEEEDDEDYNAASVSEEEEEGEDDDSEDSDAASEEDEAAIAVGGTRMATIGNDPEDVITEAQSGRSVSSSPSSSSPQQSVNLKSSDVLDCPICSEPLKKPIYQCTNGHLACSTCLAKLRKRCPFCRSHIGDIRCRAMEKVLEASVVPCRNAMYGCKETASYPNQSSHEKVCIFVRCSCPMPNCNYTGSYTELESHASSAHTWDSDNFIPFVLDCPQIFSMNLSKQKMIVFQEEKKGDLIVVQAFKGSHGVYMTVSCIAPMTPGLPNFSCSLAKLDAYTTLRLGLMVKKTHKVGEQEEPKDGFMLIPSYMLTGDHLKLQICIGREYKYVHI